LINDVPLISSEKHRYEGGMERKVFKPVFIVLDQIDSWFL